DRYSSAIATRNRSAPQVIGYWLTSSAMACRAASLSSCGAGKSGKPCERLIAPCATESRVISRITDSVNEDALREGRIFDIRAMIVVEIEDRKSTRLHSHH